MRIALHILEFWALAFVSLSATLVLLNIFWNLIEQDLCLKTVGKEAVIIGIASFIEAISLWLLLPLGPIAMRAMILPGLLVGVIYKVAHFEDWTRYEIICLLLFQLIIVAAGASLLVGNFAAAIGILVVFGIILAVVASFLRGL
jgi:hypothetical protein